MKFWGFDGSSEVHSDFNFRYITMLKWLDNGGFMNAGNGITGFNKAEQGGALNVNTGWGFMHELGHNFDTNNRAIGETTNNILPLHFQKLEGRVSKITEQGLWESRILPKVALEDYSNNEYYPENDQSLLTHIAPLWQLQLYKEDFWPTFEKTFRESDFKGGSVDDRHNEWVKVASDIFKLDLYEHFARHGMDIRESTKEYTSKYPKPDKKLWYINDKIYLNDGGQFTEKLDYSIKSIKKDGENIRLSFNINEEDKKNVLGYEIFKDGKPIAFTAENTFVDKTATANTNHEYKIIAYDMELNSKGEANAKTFDPIISAEDNITIGINKNFDPMEYVIAESYDGRSIKENVKVVKNTVDVSKKGTYEVTYEITEGESTKTTSSKVYVASRVDYLSDLTESSSKVGWNVLGKDKSPGGRRIQLYKDNSKVNFSKGLGAHADSEIVYNIENEGYSEFRAYVGIDGEISIGKGLATFELYVDGKKVYDSGKLKSGESYKEVVADITGAKELKLVTTNGGNGIGGDNTVWADAKLITNNSKPVIEGKDIEYKIGDEVNLMKEIIAKDAEDGDITSKVKIKESNFEKNKLGRFKVTYSITDSDNNTVEKSRYITVYDSFNVKKSYYGTINDLNKYNELFKIPVNSVTNNGGKYGASVSERAIDNNLDLHFETGKPNSESFKNEAIFTFDKIENIDKIAYGSRKGGKGFATKFDIYVSEELEGNDFYKVGEGSYNGSRNDVIEFKLKEVNARRVKFVFTEAYENWASIGELSFYKEDKIANSIENELFVNNEKSEVTEKYNSLEKLDELRNKVKGHLAYNIFEESLAKAEEIIKSKFPTIEVPKDISTKVGIKLDLNEKYSALDKEDGNITNRVKITGKDNVNYNKPGTYEITYKVSDSDGNTVTKVRKVNVVDMDDYNYVSDKEWLTAQNSYGKAVKDKAVSNNQLRLTGENSGVMTYNKGIGTHSTSTITYDLTKIKAHYFTSYIGVDRQMFNTVGSVGFQVLLDGTKVYDSGVMNSKDKSKFIEVDLAGAKELKLIVNDGGNGNGSDHANWADAKFHYANENAKEVNRSELDKLLKEIENLKVEEYTKETMDGLLAVKEKVEKELENGYNQEKVNKLYEELKTAKEGLKEIVKFDGLKELVESTKNLKEYLYTEESMNHLKGIITKAEEMLKDKASTAEDVKTMTKNLKNAIDKLVTRKEKIDLEKLVEFSKTITDISFVGATNHQEIRWDNFLIVRGEVIRDLEDPKRNEEETKRDIRKLQYYIEDLEMKK